MAESTETRPIDGDPYLAFIINSGSETDRNPVLSVLVEAKDIALGGLNFLRQHPVGSLEVGGALAAAGLLKSFQKHPHPAH